MSSSTSATSTNYSRVPQQEGSESGGGGGGSSTPTTAASSSAGNNNNDNRNSNNNRFNNNSSSSTSSVLQLRSRTERLQDKGVAVCWVLLAYFVARWSKFFSYVLWGITSTTTGESDNSSSDPPPPSAAVAAATAAAVVDMNILILRLALIGFGIVTLLGLYLTVYLPRFKGLALKDSSGWAPVYCPNVIPSMSVTFLISVMLLIRSVWPVYGFLAPFIVSSQFMALLMSTHLLPTFGFC